MYKYFPDCSKLEPQQLDPQDPEPKVGSSCNALLLAQIRPRKCERFQGYCEPFAQPPGHQIHEQFSDVPKKKVENKTENPFSHYPRALY
jgi:hypothetical protein